MKLGIYLASCLLFVGFACARRWQDGDTIIIDPVTADDLPVSDRPRTKRANEVVVVEESRSEDEDTVLVRSGECRTVKGRIGRCTTLKECYPLLAANDPDSPPSDSNTLNDPLADQLILVSGLCSGRNYRDDPMFEQVARSEVLICCAMQTRIVAPLPPPPPPQPNNTESDTKAGCGLLKIDASTLPPASSEESQNRTNNGGKIVAGREARRGEFPWIVALMNNRREFCGGSLIDNNNVLTAAHCVQHMGAAEVQKLTIQIGDHDIYSTGDGPHEVRTASRILYHKDFSMQHLHHDVALIHLSKPVQWSKYVQPVCLHKGSPNSDNQPADVAGWGQLRDGGSQPSKLQTADVGILTNADCSSRYGSNAPSGIGRGMVCAGGRGKDSCRGDSGGPLTINTRSQAQIVGIVSWGIGCGSYPGVYTRVEKYVPWITKNMKRSFAE